LSRGGEIVLAGFYPQPVTFSFPLAFMKEARLRVAAEWQPDDLHAALEMVCDGRLSLGGLITHRRSFREAPAAYATAFRDPECLKMLIEWRAYQ
jgi:3-hydroxyethyl bacteriochlorophyllide a dehydrogenase